MTLFETPFFKKHIFLFALASVLSMSVFAQGNDQVNNGSPSLFLELGGNAVLVSANYDRRFSQGNDGMGLRAGLGVSVSTYQSRSGSAVLMIPVGINYLLGKGSHHLEAGAGVTIGKVDLGKLASRNTTVVFVPSLGYRYQPPSKGANFRIFASPFVGKSLHWWAGLSFGFPL